MSRSSTRPPAIATRIQNVRMRKILLPARVHPAAPTRYRAPALAGPPPGRAALAQTRVERGERGAPGNEVGVAERVERRVDRLLRVVQVARVGLRVQQPGDDLARGVPLLQVVHHGDL